MTVPTRPKSALDPSTKVVNFSAISVFESRPEIETALMPWPHRDCATAGPISFANTLSTISKTSGVVTRKPPINSVVIPADSSAAPICGPPPWTITISTPCEMASAIACANSPCESDIAWPPNFTTIMRRFHQNQVQQSQQNHT